MRTGVQFSSFIMIGLLLPCITARVLDEEATDPLRFRNITQPSETLEKVLALRFVWAIQSRSTSHLDLESKRSVRGGPYRGVLLCQLEHVSSLREAILFIV